MLFYKSNFAVQRLLHREVGHIAILQKNIAVQRLISRKVGHTEKKGTTKVGYKNLLVKNDQLRSEEISNCFLK